MGDLIIRKVTDADVDSLVRLYCEVWPELKSIHQQKADFVLRESTGVSYCAEKDGKIVGSRTSFYMPVYYGSRKLNCVQFADSCIHDSCRRQGLFLKLNQAFLQDFFEEKGGELVYNISVQASKNAYEKLGWVYIESLALFDKYARPLNILRKTRFDIRKLHGSVREDIETKVHEIDSRLLDARSKWFQGKELIHVNYTPETFQWRMKSGNGIKMYQVEGVGCAIYKVSYKECGIKILTVGDFFLYDYTKESLKKLEKALRKHEKPDRIIGYFTLSHPLFNLMRKCHYRGGKRFLFHGVKVIADEMKQICLNPRNWAISFLDIDTF